MRFDEFRKRARRNIREAKSRSAKHLKVGGNQLFFAKLLVTLTMGATSLFDMYW